MAFLYESGNYIIGNDNVNDFTFLKCTSVYTKNSEGYTVVVPGYGQMVILNADITSLFNSAALTTTYTESSLLTFLRNKTGNCEITSVGTIDIGTTEIVNGTEGRVLFQGAGDVIQQDAQLFWNNTTKSLGVGASPKTGTKIYIKTPALGAVTDKTFWIENEFETKDNFFVQQDGDAGFQGSNGQRVFFGATGYIQQGTSRFGGYHFDISDGKFLTDFDANNFDIERIKVLDINGSGTAWDENGNQLIRFRNGTAPTANTTDGFKQYSSNSPGVSCAHFMDGDGFIQKIFTGAAIANPSGGLVVDAQARTAIVAILNRMRVTGGMGFILD